MCFWFQDLKALMNKCIGHVIGGHDSKSCPSSPGKLIVFDDSNNDMFLKCTHEGTSEPIGCNKQLRWGRHYGRSTLKDFHYFVE